MQMLMLGDTITAIATPPAPGGIGVVRLSGPDAEAIALRHIKLKKETLEPRVATLCELRDERRKAAIDRCLVIFFPGPNSYTGEDLVEFSCHGSMPVLRRLVAMLVDAGARPARPGEFTLRAVINGRIDLTQAEAINRLVRARTLLQAEQAVEQLKGAVSRRVKKIDAVLLDAVARMGASVDFADEDEEFISRAEAEKLVEWLEDELGAVVEGFVRADLLRDGAVAVIAGAANVGKSTLFNALLKRERSIVDAQPGTTRDFIAETIDLHGIPLTLVDTAGLRSAGGRVEIEGMRRTEERMGEADIVVLVAECGRELSAEEKALAARMRGEGKRTIIVFNKCDLEPPSLEDGVGEVAIVSALKGDGLGALLEALERALEMEEGERRDDSGPLITELRQQQLFSKAAEAVGRAAELLRKREHDEVVLEELNCALETLGEITGRKSADDVLQQVFSNFCIGK